MHLHLNPIGGLAGDMFCAALLHARPDLLASARNAVACLSMPVPVRLELPDTDGLLQGKHFKVSLEKVDQAHHHHHHTAFRDIRRMLSEAPLSPDIRERAIHIFTLLAEAEGKVHGCDPESVSFHEVGAWDSIADIVSAAALLDALQVQSCSCGPLPLGGGRVKTAHGLLPVPVPATSLLMEGLPVIDDGIAGERVTPTGAAILRSLEPGQGRPANGILRGSGMGFGTRQLDGIANCLQVLCIQAVAAARPDSPDFRPDTDRVISLRFEVDDQTPEDFALAMDHLRSTDGVLSAISLQAIGKQGRPTMSVEILARPESLQQVSEACFRETSTIGLRWRETGRLILPRRQQQVVKDAGELEVKIVQRPQGLSAKVESREVAALDSHSKRQRLREQGATLATGKEINEETGHA